MLEQTITKLGNVVEPLSLLMENIQIVEENNAKKTELEKRLERLKKSKPIVFSMCIFIVLFLRILIFTFTERFKNFIFAPSSFVGCIIFAAVVSFIVAGAFYLMINNSGRKQMRRSEVELQQCREQIAQAENVVRTQAPSVRENIDIVPVDYRYPLAMKYIYSCLRNQRAATIGEAINLYEDQIHKWKMESMQQEIMQICLKQQQDMRQVKNLSALSAAAGVASLFQ